MKKAVLIGCLAALLVGMLGFGALVVWFATGPEGGVRLANEMEPYATAYLAEHDVLEPDEDVLAYYDATLSLNGNEAALVTSRRLIYLRDGQVFSIALADIEDVHHTRETLIGDVLEVQGSSGPPLKIEIAPLNQGETFVRVLNAEWERAKAGGR